MSDSKKMIRVLPKEIAEVTVWCFRALGYEASYGAAAARLVQDAEIYYAQGIHLLLEVINSSPTAVTRPVNLLHDGESKADIDGLGQHLLLIGTSLVDFLVGRVKQRKQYLLHVQNIGGGEMLLPLLVHYAAEMGIDCGGAVGGKRWLAREGEHVVEAVEPLDVGLLRFGGTTEKGGELRGEVYGKEWPQMRQAAVKQGVEVDYGMWQGVKRVAEGILVPVNKG